MKKKKKRQSIAVKSSDASRSANAARRKENYKEYSGFCLTCGKVISKNRKHCGRICSGISRRRPSKDLIEYRLRCKFNFSIKDFPYEFDFLLIKEHGWYRAKNHGDNLTGVSRDHMLSVKWGFKNKIDPSIISHPANCQLLLHNDNSSKNDKCSITINELLTKIDAWNNKYKKMPE